MERHGERTFQSRIGGTSHPRHDMPPETPFLEQIRMAANRLDKRHRGCSGDRGHNRFGSVAVEKPCHAGPAHPAHQSSISATTTHSSTRFRISILVLGDFDDLILQIPAQSNKHVNPLPVRIVPLAIFYLKTCADVHFAPV
jgi:hypothetical protein